MTDNTPDNLRKLAEEWARDNLDEGYFPHGGRAMAAAKVIAALPVTIVDGVKLREVIEDTRDALGDTGCEAFEALLPAPAPRTMADMTSQEREECHLMQVERVDEKEISVIIGANWKPGRALILHRDGMTGLDDHINLVPLTDEPRMEWPASEPVADTPEPEQPQPEDVPAGEVWLVRYGDGNAVGMRSYRDSLPWTVFWDNRDMQVEQRVLNDGSVALVHRLVPEQGDVS